MQSLFLLYSQFHGSQRTKQLEIFEFSRADSNTFPLLYITVGKVKLNQKDDMSHIFLYCIVMNHNQMPVGQMISAAHDINHISFFLSEWLKTVGQLPKTIVCDHSFALLNAICRSFMDKNLKNYVDLSFKSLQSNNSTPFPVYLRIDYNHFIHLITRWKCFINSRKLLKHFYIRCVN